MAKQRAQLEPAERMVELLRIQTIVQLGLAGVAQAQIRQIVGGAMSDVTSVVKLLNSGKRGRGANGF